MCPARVRPERPEYLMRQDAACASGHIFFFLMDIVICMQPGKPSVNDTMSPYPSLHTTLPLSTFIPP